MNHIRFPSTSAQLPDRWRVSSQHGVGVGPVSHVKPIELVPAHLPNTQDGSEDTPQTPPLMQASLPKGWPMSVSCEMNVDAWKIALRESGLLPGYQDVIDGFIVGFDQGIPEHTLRHETSGEDLPYFIPPNHSSAILAREKISTSITDEVRAGRMFGPFTKDQVASVYPFFRSSPMGAVINGDGSLRPINDLSYPKNNPHLPSVNSFVDAQRFKTTWTTSKLSHSFSGHPLRSGS